MCSGIYCLLFSNNTYYVGKSTDVYRRYKEHIKALHNNTGFKKVQKSFNTAGVPELLVLQECDINTLSSNEHYWINVLNGPNI